MRAILLGLAMWTLASPAFALRPADLIGEWTTEWANAGNEALSGGGPLFVRQDSAPEMLDGLTPAPGMDGAMNGEAQKQPDGSILWSGAWASVWPEGVSRGTFRLVFTDAGNFTGTWSTDDGEVADAAWNGRRAD